MMKNLYYIYVFFLLFVIASCTNNSQKIEKFDLGEVSYHPGFLWSDPDTTFLNKTLELGWSKDAKADSNSYAEYEFVDNNSEIVPCEELEVYIDGQKLSPVNRFKVLSSQDQVQICFRFLPAAKEGRHQGYLLLVKHNIDMQGNTELQGNQPYKAFQWSICVNHNMNPLAKALLWILCSVLSLFLLWIFVGRKISFPRFRTFRKQVVVKKNGTIIVQKRVVFTGAIKVVFYSQPVRQSFWEKLFKGKIVSLVNPEFVEPIIFTPSRDRKKAHVKATEYTISVNPIPSAGQSVISLIPSKLIIEMN